MAEPLYAQLIAEVHAATDRMNEVATAVREASGRASVVGQGAVEMQHYVDMRVGELHKSIDTRFASVQRDVETTAKNVFDKFLHSNAVREEMRQLEGTFPTRPEMESQLGPLRKELDVTRMGISKLEGDREQLARFQTFVDTYKDSLKAELRGDREQIGRFQTFVDTHKGAASQEDMQKARTIALFAIGLNLLTAIAMAVKLFIH